MKRKRFIAILCLSFTIVFFVIVSSSFFCLKNIDVVFFDEESNVVSLENNVFINTKQKLNNIVSSIDFEYGKSIFLLEKDKYIEELEFKNPFLKILQIESVFPDKILIKASERKPFYQIRSHDTTMFCDSQFKILFISNSENFESINLSITRNFSTVDFFEFFDVRIQAFEVGQFLYKNNLILSQLVLFYDTIFQMGFNYENCFATFSEIEIQEISSGTITMVFHTKNTDYGVKLKIEDVFFKFDFKLKKLLNAFLTLRNKEKVKTTYGSLIVEKDLNCKWYST